MAACCCFITFHRLSSDKILFSNQISSQNLCICHQHCHKQYRSRFLASSSKKSRNSDVSKEEQTPVNHKNDLEDEKLKAENLAEVNRLKFMLHHKELELDQLKQQIEKEKAALSALQNNAEIEINKAHKLISEKETELYAAEGSLSGLKEVEVKYTGYGEIVELAGSFNGWHHKKEMDPQSSSIGVDPTETRKSQLWRTVLWLYPGVYEIKFVVDGDWRIDHSMESVTRDTPCTATFLK